jgi:hypothetical protein
VFANEIHNAPPAIPLLDMLEGEHSPFGAPEPAAKQHREDSPVPQPLLGGGIRCVQERLGHNGSTVGFASPKNNASNLATHQTKGQSTPNRIVGMFSP